MKSLTKFEEEVDKLNYLREDAAKLHTRSLFKRREALEADPRQDDEGEGFQDLTSPASKWFDDMCRNSEALLRVYIEHIATNDWVFKQLAEQVPHALSDVEGEQALFDELRRWAEG